jgi:hypothetical protein
MTSLVWWLHLLLLIGIVALFRWRWKKVNQPWLSDERCEELSWLVIDDLFENASEAGVHVQFRPSYWLNLGVNDSEWIYLCRWMEWRGFISVPNSLGVIDIMMNSAPTTLALTKKSWELIMNNKIQPNISIGSIGDVNGPINVGGDQIVIFGQGLSGDDLQALVVALRQDAKDASEPRASSLREAADTLQDAAEGRASATSPAVTGALKWVRQCVTDAVSNAGGQVLLTATVGVARVLGWV